MIPYALPSAAGHVIQVTGTATTLQNLIRTAVGGSSTFELPNDADAIDLRCESGDIRVLFGDATPTTSAGFFCANNSYKSFRGPLLRDMQLIATGVNVNVSILIGRSVPGLQTT